MATNTCDCNATSNKLSDLEVMELVLQAAAVTSIGDLVDKMNEGTAKPKYERYDQGRCSL